MIVENLQNGKIVECNSATTSFQRFRGLMFRGKIIPILFDFKKNGIFPIHSFFVFSKFVAFYISSEGEILEVYPVNPFQPYVSNVGPARYLLEIDHMRAAWFRKGDKVKITCSGGKS